MMSAFTLVCLVCTFLEQPATLETMAQEVSKMLAAEPKVDTNLFNETFLKEVPTSQLRGLCRRIYSANGVVTGVTRMSRDSAVEGKFLFQFEKGAVMDVTLNISSDANPRIIGLFFQGARPGLKTWAELQMELEKLPGKVSFCAAQINNPPAPASDAKATPIHTLAELNSNSSLAIGSTFKLYILSTLIADHATWHDVIPLKSELFSLPSGVMHKWPAESPVTLHTLAVEMISISDNTATDHLLHHLGRERVWEQLSRDNSQPEKTHPFLSTLEMFKLKSNEALRQRYLNGDFNERMKLLENEVKQFPRAKTIGNSEPLAVDTIEWFASAADLCQLMASIDADDSENGATALKILAVNPGVGLSRDQFPYVGYKGGSEAGVINMTWLLRDAEDHRYAVAGTWNNESAAVDNGKFSGLMTAALHLLRNAK